MAFAITIGGSAKDIKAGTLNISATANGRATASFGVLSTDGSYRPAIDAEVIMTDGATRIFGGLVEKPSERGLVSGSKDALLTSVSAVDFNAYAERRYVNETLAAGTLKSMLTTLVGTYLDDYGVTLHGSQVNGPTLPELTYDYRPLTEVLNELSTLTAKYGEQFVWRIDFFKVLRMFQPSTSVAPFDILTDTPTGVIGDITVETTREHYANRVIVKVPSKTEANRVETFTGDGTTSTFQLQYTMTGNRGYVTSDSIYETLTTTAFIGEATWTYDPITNTITRESGPPANLSTTSITFDGAFTGLGIAEDAGEITAHGLYERVVVIDNVPDDTTVQALADAYLAQALPVTKTIKYRTHMLGLVPGQSQTITVPRRDLDETVVITDVVTRDLGQNILARDITAVADAQTNLGLRGWRDVYKAWLGDKAGGGAAAVVGAASPQQLGPGAPNRSNQFNDSGRFGGNAEWLFDKTTTTVMLGSNHDEGGGIANMLIGSGNTVI